MTAPHLLVTAVGGDLGQALVKALRLVRRPFVIHGCDVDPRGVGPAFVGRFHPVPSARDAGAYVSALDQLCSQHGIAAVIPANEAEMRALSTAGDPPTLPSGTPVVCQDAAGFNRMSDKLTCMSSLDGRVALAPYADGADAAAVAALAESAGFPLVVKPRRTSGSRQVGIARNKAELDGLLATVDEPLVQQFIPDSAGEYSVGVFLGDGLETAICFRRSLGPVGCSWDAQTVEDEEVLTYAMEVARASGLRGSFNVQVRKNERGVWLLEVNARFSSLVAARALAGFRDAEWSVEQALGNRPEPPILPYGQIRFRRFFHEVIDFGHGFRGISAWQPREHSPTNRLLIRADASAEIGAGHVMRCVALAQAWRARGGEASFLMARTTPLVMERLTREGFAADVFDATRGTVADAQETASWALAQGAAWVVVDGYGFDPSYLKTVRACGVAVLCLDDEGQADVSGANLCLNQNLYGAKVAYPSGSTTKFLLGPEYALLREEFKRESLRRHASRRRVSRIVVTLGAADPANATSTVVRALCRIHEPGLEVIVVVGGCNVHGAAIEAAAKGLSYSYRVLHDVQEMAPLLQSADLVISSAGSTVLEIFACGLPSILLVLCAHQRRVADEAARLGAAVNLGERMDEDRLAAEVERLVGDEAAREQLASRAAELVDGRGALRVVQAMMALTHQGWP